MSRGVRASDWCPCRRAALGLEGGEVSTQPRRRRSVARRVFSQGRFSGFGTCRSGPSSASSWSFRPSPPSWWARRVCTAQVQQANSAEARRAYPVGALRRRWCAGAPALQDERGVRHAAAHDHRGDAVAKVKSDYSKQPTADRHGQREVPGRPVHSGRTSRTTCAACWTGSRAKLGELPVLRG